MFEKDQTPSQTTMKVPDQQNEASMGGNGPQSPTETKASPSLEIDDSRQGTLQPTPHELVVDPKPKPNIEICIAQSGQRFELEF